MAAITNHDLEVEARAILRERIAQTPWFSGPEDERRQERIELEVELWWHLMVREAAERLVDRASSSLRLG